MGKLKELWEEYKSLDKGDPRRKELQQQINDTEQWCINNGYKGFTITRFHDSIISPRYPNVGAVFWDDIK